MVGARYQPPLQVHAFLTLSCCLLSTLEMDTIEDVPAVNLFFPHSTICNLVDAVKAFHFPWAVPLLRSR